MGNVAQRVRNLLQDAIDQETEMKANPKEHERSLPELECEGDLKSREDRPPEYYRLPLEDLMPAWHAILKNWRTIEGSRKQEAKRFFDREIEPLLESSTRHIAARVLQALDLLDMPFWRHRWHTYEIWATVVALQTLDEYKPMPIVVARRIPLDGTQPALVARLSGEVPGFVHVQSETTLPSTASIQSVLWKRKIKPDLRVGLTDPASHDGTVTIVEFKQRRDLDQKHVMKVMTAYSAGSPRGGGVIIINYDDAPAPSPGPPSGCCLLGNVRPGPTGDVEAYKRAVKWAVKQGGLQPPRRRKDCVLLDVSGSMEDQYKNSKAQTALRRLLALPYVTVLRFNDGLVSGGDLREDGTLTTGGSTQLGSALRQMFSLPEFGIPERLLVVTDGGHDHPVAELSKISEVRECSPDDFGENLDWL
jgi:hypothetical protein